MKVVKIYRRNQINKNFFNSLLVSNSYVAGLYAADGYLIKNAYKLSISLKENDKIVLEEICKLMGCSLDRIKLYDNNRSFPNSQKVARFVTPKSEQLIADYLTFFNRLLQTSNIDFCLSYIKGYIDGDGSITVHSKNKPYRKINIVGPYNKLCWIKQCFDLKFLSYTKKIADIRYHKCGIYEYSIKGRRADNIFSYLSELQTPAIKRKWCNL